MFKKAILTFRRANIPPSPKVSNLQLASYDCVFSKTAHGRVCDWRRSWLRRWSALAQVLWHQVRGSLVGSRRRYLPILLRLQVQMCAVFFCVRVGLCFRLGSAQPAPGPYATFLMCKLFGHFSVFFCQYPKFALGIDAHAFERTITI